MKRLKKEFVYTLYLLFIIIFVMLSIISYQKYTQEHILSQITYKSIDNSSYDVYYSGSDIINGKVIQDEYIKKYTDKIYLNYDYVLDFSNIVSGTEEILVKANMIVYAPNSTSEIYRSDTEYLLKNKKIEYENSNRYNYKNSIELDYQKYIKMYDEIKNETSIISDAVISVEFVSSSVAKPKGMKQITKTDNIVYEIPLSSVTYSIGKKTNISNDSIVSKKIDDNKNKIYLYLFISCTFIIIVLITMFINRIIEYQKNKNSYKNKLSSILKSYDNIIVNIENLPDFNENNVINVTEFEELLDAQMEMRLPINYCEIEKGYESDFMIITNDTIWLYKLKKERRNEK